MKLEFQRQESYSRGELLLRSFFGPIYIGLPHGFLLMFFGIWGQILRLISFWIILFTGRYPESFFDYQVKLMRWNLRVQARYLNLSDGYPAFGLNAEDERVTFEVPYPENLSWVSVLMRALLGFFYVLIPHSVLLMFYGIGVMVISVAAWFAVLFTGEFPEKMHNMLAGYLRWNTRVQLYMNYMTDDYPPFTGKPDQEDSPSINLYSLSDVSRLMAPVFLVLIGFVTIQYGTATHQNGGFMFGATCLLLAGFASLLISTRRLTKNLRIAMMVGLALITGVLGYANYRSIKDPIEFNNEKVRRYAHVIQRLKDIRTAQLAYKAKYQQYTGSLDTLVHFVKHDSLPQIMSKDLPEYNPDSMTLKQAIEMGYAIRDTIPVAVKDSLFGVRHRQGRHHPFVADSLPVVPFTGGERFKMQAGTISRSGADVPVFEAVDSDPFDRNHVLQVGSMVDPKTNGNWE